MKKHSTKTPTANGQTDRTLGTVVGSAVGDALGAGYEFTNPDPKDQIAMIGGGPFEWAPGEWTDDTQMAVGILDAINSGSIEIAAVSANFLTWFNARPADVGIQTSSVLGSAEEPEDLPAAAIAYLDAHPDSAGNGGLMRTAPVALSSLGDRTSIANNAAEIAALTHAHPDSIAACVLWSLAIEEAISNSDNTFPWEQAIRRGFEYLEKDQKVRWDTLVTEAITGPPAIFNPNGWVVTAFQAALSAIVNTPEPIDQSSDHFTDALVAAVRIGHDTDTVAAIAGGLLGARWGFSAIPTAWTDVLHGQRRNGTELLALTDLQTLVMAAI